MDWLDQRYLNDLVRRAQGGSSDAFAELYSAVSDRIFSYCCFMNPDEEASYALMEEVFGKIMREFFSLQAADQFLPWAMHLAYLSGKRTESDSTYFNLPITHSQIMLMVYVQGIAIRDVAMLLNMRPSLIRRCLKYVRNHMPTIQDSSNAAGRIVKSCQPDAYRSILVLEKVYSEAQKKPNAVPLEALSSYAVYRKERFSLQRGVLVAVLLLFALLPMLFVLPRYSIESEKAGKRGLPVYTISVDNLLPVNSVTAFMRSHPLPVYEKNAHVYRIEPVRNGELLVEVELFNRQTVKTLYIVDDVDRTAPRLLRSEVADHLVYLYVSDEEIGVDYREVYAVSASGNVIYPLSYDEEEGVIVFDYPSESTDVYIPDHIGNILHLSMSFR